MVSITSEGEEKERLVLITCKRKHLEQYLAATGKRACAPLRFYDDRGRLLFVGGMPRESEGRKAIFSSMSSACTRMVMGIHAGRSCFR